MPAVYVIPKAYEWAMRRAILEEQSRIASGFYAEPFMADKLDGDAVITIHDGVPANAAPQSTEDES